jgi:hypothetical protein
MKSFFKLSLLKVVATFVLFIVFSWLWQITFGIVIMDESYYGVPLHFFVAWGPCQAGQNCSEFNALYLAVDIIFWYVVGAILVLWFEKK